MGENLTSLLAYHILGPEELVYARELWEDVEKVRGNLVAPGSGLADGNERGSEGKEAGGQGEGEGLIQWTGEIWEKEGMFGLRRVF